MAPVLAIVVPCYNEEEVLPVTLPLFLNKLDELVLAGLAAPDSRLLFVDDGSRDATWNLICEAASNDVRVAGITLSRNRGHQNALFAGLMEALTFCDVSISIDVDGQDDCDAMDAMLRLYAEGNDVVYGVRDDRSTDTLFKRFTAQAYYRLLNLMDVHAIFNAADYRLMSKKALEALAEYSEVNLFLRGLVPHLGLPSSEVTYARRERLEGKTHYPLRKMLHLAFDGITSFSVRPIRLIIGFGFLVSLFSLALIIWALVVHFAGHTVPGWSSNLILIAFFGGLQILAIGIIGEYIGKIYLEVKERPRYFVANRVGFEESK
ncbi:MAG: glycosyltransferase family 2 protein [Actinomycetaceae bacterium]|nr:glycosyltransferase family 2 protein [Actinomycetaceae bacterium]